MLLEMAAVGHGDRVALVSGGESLSAAELFRAAGAAARELEASGARHAALLDVNSPALPVLLFGGWSDQIMTLRQLVTPGAIALLFAFAALTATASLRWSIVGFLP